MTTLVFLFGPNVVDSLAPFLEAHQIVSLLSLKKKIVQGKIFKSLSQCGIMGSHYKTLFKLSLHASKSKKLIYCHYTVEREINLYGNLTEGMFILPGYGSKWEHYLPSKIIHHMP